jgi:cytochrome c
MKNVSVILLMSVFMFVLAASTLQAQDKVATPADARELLKKVADYTKANGCEKTFAEINKGTAFKIYKNAYPTATNLSGMSFANAKVPTLVGRNLLGIKDADGKPFVQIGLENRKKNFKEKDSAIVTEYKWMDTKTNKTETRSMIGVGYACGGKIGDVSLSITYEGKM